MVPAPRGPERPGPGHRGPGPAGLAISGRKSSSVAAWPSPRRRVRWGRPRSIALLPLGNRAGTASSNRSDVPQHSGMTSEVEKPVSSGDCGARNFEPEGHRVHMLTAVLVAAAVILLFKVVGPLHELPAPGQIPWWCSSRSSSGRRCSCHIQFRRDAHSFSLSELPLVAGLFFAPPVVVVLSMGRRDCPGAHDPPPPVAVEDRLQPRELHRRQQRRCAAVHAPVDHHDALSA